MDIPLIGATQALTGLEGARLDAWVCLSCCRRRAKKGAAVFFAMGGLLVVLGLSPLYAVISGSHIAFAAVALGALAGVFGLAFAGAGALWVRHPSRFAFGMGAEAVGFRMELGDGFAREHGVTRLLGIGEWERLRGRPPADDGARAPANSPLHPEPARALGLAEERVGARTETSSGNMSPKTTSEGGPRSRRREALERGLREFQLARSDPSAADRLELLAGGVEGGFNAVANAYAETLDMNVTDPAWSAIAHRMAKLFEERMGDLEKAKETYRYVLNRLPGDRRAQENLDRLRRATGEKLAAENPSSRPAKMRLIVVVNLEWKGTLGDYWGYVLQTNGVSVDGSEVRYVDKASDSLSRDMTGEHRRLADAAAGPLAPQFLKVIKATAPTGMHSRLYVYGTTLR